MAPLDRRTKRDILLCAFGFPPLGGPTERRWVEFVRVLAARGWSIDVLAACPSPRHPRYDETSLRLIPPTVRVYRTFPGVLHHMERAAYARAGVKASGASLLARARAGGLALGRAGYRTIVRQLLVPDRMVDWTPFALATASRLLRRNRYRLIVSSSSPQTSHVVGYVLKRRTRLPWVGDWSDPLSFNPNYVLSPWQRVAFRALEEKLITTMDHVVVSTEETKTAYLQHYPALPEEKVSVVYYGYNPELFGDAVKVERDGLRLVYTGIFLKTIRRPYALFDALAEIQDLPVEVVIAGAMDAEFVEYARSRGLANTVQFLGQRPHAEVLRLQKEASVLLLLGNRGGLQLPGKIFEYMAARRPILCIKNDQHDIAADMVARHNRGLVVDNDAAHIAEAIQSLHAAHAAGTLDQRFSIGPLEQFAWPNVATQMEGVLAGVLDASGAPVAAGRAG